MANDVLRHELSNVQEVLTEAVLKAAEGLLRLRDLDARIAQMPDKQ
jgi:hypothetical protein